MTAERLTYTPDEVAERLGIGRDSVYRAVKRGEIPSVRVGGRILVPRTWLETFAAGQQRGSVAS